MIGLVDQLESAEMLIFAHLDYRLRRDAAGQDVESSLQHLLQPASAELPELLDSGSDGVEAGGFEIKDAEEDLSCGEGGADNKKSRLVDVMYAPALEDRENTMRAAQFLEPGEPAVIKTRRIPRPQCCEATQVLIKVGTGGLNPIDFKMRRNEMVNATRPLPIVSGYDFSGNVERIGNGVLGFRPGDTVYGMLPLQGHSWGAFQEYVVTNYSIIAHVPSKITAREAAGLPLVGLTTIQALAPVLRNWQQQGQNSTGKKILVQAGFGVYYHCNPVSPDAQGLRSIASWVDAGLIKPVVDRSFGLDEVAKAHEYLEKGHASGKVLIEIGTITE
eukprot:Skav210245  [mRNA]  locus=scaffold1929:100391:108669:+ [translate_table: standard]